jgi:hypothetical protein
VIDSTPWINRPHGGGRTVPIALSLEERDALEQRLRLGKVERRIAIRAQAALLLADGVTPRRSDSARSAAQPRMPLQHGNEHSS